jgi:polyhydroxyalkanoate synthesis repressor PhaR
MADTTIRLIKKYKNRRLYDMERSQYITLEELRTYVLQGIDFQVIDAADGADLTSMMLLQLFMELEEHSRHFLSPEMLRQLIVWSHHPMSQDYKKMLEQALISMQQYPLLKDMQQKTTELWAKQSEQMLKSWQDLFRQRHES